MNHGIIINSEQLLLTAVPVMGKGCPNPVEHNQSSFNYQDLKSKSAAVTAHASSSNSTKVSNGLAGGNDDMQAEERDRTHHRGKQVGHLSPL